MRQLNRLLSLLNILPGEGRLVGLVLVYAILLYTANVLARTASYALFLSAFDAANLPYAYIGVAVFATLVSAVYLKLNERFSLAKVLIGAHLFLLLTLVAYWLGLFAAPAWLLFSLPIYFGVNNTLTISSFWNLLGRLYSLQQGKRLFGLLSAGENIATVAAGFVSPLLVAWFGTPNLFLIAAVFMVATLGLLMSIARGNAAQMAGSDEGAAAKGKQQSAPSLFQDGYIVLIIGLFALFIIGIYFVDNIFYSQAEIQYPDEDALASFIGLFFGVLGALSLGVQFFVAGWVLNRFGVRPLILATPTGVLALTLLFALTGTFTAWQIALFWLAVAANMYRFVLDAVDSAAINVLYQPLPDRQRTHVQTFVQGIVYPLTIGLTGLMLLFLINILNFGPVQLAYVALPITVAWLIVGVSLGRAYPRRLQQALSRRSLNGPALPRPDRASLDIYRQGLTSPQVGQVLYTLTVLAEIAPESLLTGLPDLLNHPERQVRLEALRQVEQLGLKEAIPLIQARLTTEGSRPVQAASLRTLAALGDQAMFDQVYPYLDHADMLLRQGVVVGLLRSGELEGILLAGEKLLAWVGSTRPEEREFAAQALGEGGIAGFYRPLITLLQDEQPAVQRAALAAAGKLKHNNLWPAITACLASPQVRSAAIPALIAGGEAALPALAAAWAKADQTSDVLTRLARICGRIGGPQASTLLRRHLDWPDVRVRSQVLIALNHCGYRATEADQGDFRRAIEAEVAQAAWTLAGLVDLANETGPTVSQPAIQLLKTSLTEALAGQRDRLFLWLALLYDPQAVRQVRDTLAAAARDDGRALAQQRDYALEIIEVMLPADLRAMLRPLVEVQPPAEQLQRLSSRFPQPSLTGHQRLAEIIRAPTAWLAPWPKACALEAVSQLAAVDLAETVTAALADPDPLVRESAVWTLARLDAAQYRRQAPTLAHDPSPVVGRAVRLLAADNQGGQAMLTLVEKVMLLRTVDFFAEAAEEILADAAATLTELEVNAGDTILTQDEPGSAMYLVVEGQVQLQNGGRNGATFGEREAFGELSLLNPTPQPAAVIALTDARLLRLDQTPLFELLEDHPPLAQAIIQRLAQRLQRASQDRAEQARADLLGGLMEKLGKKS